MATTTLKPAFRRRTQALKPPSLSSSATFKTQEGEGDYIDLCCEECGSGELPEELLLCDKCDLGFHIFCLRPILACVPKGLWFCASCSKQKKPKRIVCFSFFPSFFAFMFFPPFIGLLRFLHCFSLSHRNRQSLLISQVGFLLIAGFPLIQTKIVDFFRIQRSPDYPQKPCCGKRNLCIDITFRSIRSIWFHIFLCVFHFFPPTRG